MGPRALSSCPAVSVARYLVRYRDVGAYLKKPDPGQYRPGVVKLTTQRHGVGLGPRLLQVHGPAAWSTPTVVRSPPGASGRASSP
eukprot:6293169-Alexandrium_andersonii.AAC.1